MRNNIFINDGLKPFDKIINLTKSKKVFLVVGKKSFNNIEKIIKEKLMHCSCFYFDNFEINPKLYDIIKGVKLFKKFAPDLVIAIGGGTPIDIAKAINLLAFQNEPFDKIVMGSVKKLNKPKTHLLVMPTTAGTGSEATEFSVIYINKKKFSLSHPSMKPNFVIADTCLISSMPKYLAGCSGFDALTQSLESFWSKNSTNESIEFSKKAMKLLVGNLEESINKPNKKNQQNMIIASNLSGKAINITKTTVPHALSYTLTSYFKMPHGHAVAILFPSTLLSTYILGNKMVKNKVQYIFSLFNCKTYVGFEKKWRKLMSNCLLEINLSSFGLNSSHIDLIVSNINIQRLSGHPVKFSKEELNKIVSRIL